MGLLEREGELAALGRLVDGGGVVVVEAGAGIGKSALLEVACGLAREAGWEVLEARGSELEAGFAFGVVRQLFELRVAGLDVAEREEVLAAPDQGTSLSSFRTV